MHLKKENVKNSYCGFEGYEWNFTIFPFIPFVFLCLKLQTVSLSKRTRTHTIDLKWKET